MIGSLARVIQGSDELTDGIDLTPHQFRGTSTDSRPALEDLNARRADGKSVELGESTLRQQHALALESDAGEIKIVLEPAGTRGSDDLRHRASRQPIGQGLRTPIADPGDLIRMLEALGRSTDRLTIVAMQRAIELDRGPSLEP